MARATDSETKATAIDAAARPLGTDLARMLVLLVMSSSGEPLPRKQKGHAAVDVQ